MRDYSRMGADPSLSEAEGGWLRVLGTLNELQPSAKSREISGPNPGDYELGSLDSRAAARAMHDAQAIDESYDRIFFGERANGERVRLFIGKNRQVLSTEAQRGDEWVHLEDEPRPVRITMQMVQAANVLWIGGPPPDIATLEDDP
jgi:hypothetical protein